MNRPPHPRANFVEAIEKANLGAHLTSLAKERLQYLADEFNAVDAARFEAALEFMLDETPGARATLARHRARDAEEKANKRTFGG